MTKEGKGYNEEFFNYFSTKSGQLSFFNTRLYGTNGTALVPINVDVSGNFVATDDNYTMTYDGSNRLSTITRASDGYYKTFGWTGNNLENISEWIAI